MGQKFCTTCGAALSDGTKFCERCGSPVEQISSAPLTLPRGPVVQKTDVLPVVSPPPPVKVALPLKSVTGILIILIVAAAAFFFLLPALSGTAALPVSLPGLAATTVVKTIATPVVTTSVPTTTMTTIRPTPVPDPFPGALLLKQKLPFGSEKVASEATVYRYWINDTYEWHNDMDNHFYVQKPQAGNKYLFVFVQMMNTGTTRVWFPPAGSIILHHNNDIYYQDQSHFKPDKGRDIKETPVEVKEIQYFQKLNGDEYVEDFGFSYGGELAYLYPGASNAVDGYIIYEVPLSLTPEKTYVEIPFNGQDRGVWKLG
jgi:hypothetical protein